jgi:hypothetical protein
MNLTEAIAAGRPNGDAELRMRIGRPESPRAPMGSQSDVIMPPTQMVSAISATNRTTNIPSL